MIARAPPKRCDTSASVREIQRDLSGIAVFAARLRPVFCAIESALIETSVALSAGATVVGGSNPNRSAAEQTESDHSRREFLTPLLIGRDFSGLTLTADKPWALNSSVNRSFGTFVVFFTSN
jgi:hypothetical protein